VTIASIIQTEQYLRESVLREPDVKGWPIEVTRVSSAFELLPLELISTYGKTQASQKALSKKTTLGEELSRPDAFKGMAAS